MVMVIFGHVDAGGIFIDYYDDDEWLKSLPYENGIALPEYSDVIMQVIIYDDEASKHIANMVRSPEAILITTDRLDSGQKYWKVALPGHTDSAILADICVQIDQLKGVGI